jgi:hypothetical protein
MSGRPREPGSGDESRRVVGVVAVVVIVLAAAAGHLVDYYAFELRLRRLDLATDASAFELVGTCALIGAATAAWVLLAGERRRTSPLVALPPLLTFLAADDILRLHDDIAHWQLLYVPVLIATFAALVAVARILPRQGMGLIGAALGLLTVSYLLHRYGEYLVDALGISRTGVLYQAKVIVKHCSEGAGWLLIALALLLGAGARRPPIGRPSRGSFHRTRPSIRSGA